MTKRETVEVESAFLRFIRKAEELGFVFTNQSNSLELQHKSETKHSMNGRICLTVSDYKNNLSS